MRPRRAYTRQVCFTPVELRDVWSSYATVMLDVSPGGARLSQPPLMAVPEAGRTPQPGDAVSLFVDVPGDSKRLQVAAVVVWAREPTALGVRFDPPLTPAALEALLLR